MKILFTGASSFTGYHFVRELSAAGHEVHALFTRDLGDYSGVRLERIQGLEGHCRSYFSNHFGSPDCFELIQSNGPWDLFCHHAADVRNYKSPDFDIVAAVTRNTLSMRSVLKELKDQGCEHMILTGSVFEAGEGAGSLPMRAFSPYGVSKGLTADICRYYCEELAIHFGKFVIANPFGIFEEPRFTQYLVRCWAKGETPSVQTPDYVRDNIHVDLLAKVYAGVAESFWLAKKEGYWSPSGYIESQGAFAQRFARAMESVWGTACPVRLERQQSFAEPMVRINTEPVRTADYDWDEAAAWESLALYYRAMALC
ncbi:MAG: NAD(P)-dependent oxidoreductase [Chlamydiia bacterium]|nr:NAD(P)-dependent oxidoreductase [Chlamydiia bacterium]